MHTHARSHGIELHGYFLVRFQGHNFDYFVVMYATKLIISTYPSTFTTPCLWTECNLSLCGVIACQSYGVYFAYSWVFTYTYENVRYSCTFIFSLSHTQQYAYICSYTMQHMEDTSWCLLNPEMSVAFH